MQIADTPLSPVPMLWKRRVLYKQCQSQHLSSLRAWLKPHRRMAIQHLSLDRAQHPQSWTWLPDKLSLSLSIGVCFWKEQ